jgi:hypothetical protein
VADWFKFYNDGLDSKGMQFAISEQPLVTSVWLVIMSEASKNRSNKIKWQDEDFELIGFARKVNISVPVFNQSIGLLERIKYITRQDGFIIIHGWDRLQSDYARGLDKGYYKKTSKRLVSKSEVSTARGEEKRGEEKKGTAAPLPPSAGIKEVFDAWNENLFLAKCLVVSDKRRRFLQVRLHDAFFSANWKAALAKLSASKFCLGQNDRGWRANFDWFIQPDTVVKIMEGKYENNGSNRSGGARNNANRNTGTLNEGKASQYRGVGKVV